MRKGQERKEVCSLLEDVTVRAEKGWVQRVHKLSDSWSRSLQEQVGGKRHFEELEVQQSNPFVKPGEVDGHA